jgi:hypothetical protein
MGVVAITAIFQYRLMLVGKRALISRMAFEAKSDKTDVIQYLTNASQDVITTFTNIRSNLKE